MTTERRFCLSEGPLAPDGTTDGMWPHEQESLVEIRRRCPDSRHASRADGARGRVGASSTCRRCSKRSDRRRGPRLLTPASFSSEVGAIKLQKRTWVAMGLVVLLTPIADRVLGAQDRKTVRDGVYT